MTLGSLFDGIGGWQLAAIRNGVTPVWSSEIEPFPMAVTKQHFPKTKQLGDITKINIQELEPVDIICAGSPCQDLLVAGKRAGLGERGDDNVTRSGLFRAAIDIVHGLRRRTGGRSPKYFVWENVLGAFSSNHGQDFRAVLEEIGQTGVPMPVNGRWASAGVAEFPACRIEWRTLDAQHWGVPQRRRRIFLVADFTEARRSGRTILFESAGLSGYTSESGESRQSVSSEVARGVGKTSGVLAFSVNASSASSNTALTERAPTLRTSHKVGVYSPPALYDVNCVMDMYENHGNDSRVKGPVNKSPAITARAGTGGVICH